MGTPLGASVDDIDGHAATLERFWRAASRGSLAALCLHLVFLAIFAALHLPFLVAVDVTSVALWSIVLLCIHRRWYALTRPLAAVELIGHAAATSWVLGWDTGFHLYVLVLVVVELQAPYPLRQRLGLVGCAAAGYTAAALWLAGRPGHVAISERADLALRLLNHGAFFAVLALLGVLYSAAVVDAEARLRLSAERDPLTGLFNRRSLVRRSAAIRAAEPERPTWVVFVDIDHFKSVNDQHGHAVGDEVIRFVADRVTRAVRANDVVARWGGEEFLVLLFDLGRDDALMVAERIRASVGAGGRGTRLPSVTVTLGVGEHRSCEPLYAALERADEALYAGKAAGRDCVQLAVAA